MQVSLGVWMRRGTGCARVKKQDGRLNAEGDRLHMCEETRNVCWNAQRKLLALFVDKKLWCSACDTD
eukprot:1159269-Pelagomonas_calceolata.AAC.8